MRHVSAVFWYFQVAMNRMAIPGTRALLRLFVLTLLAISLVQCASTGSGGADGDEGEAVSNSAFPIGVYFVRGQKPIADEDYPTDFRRDPETARDAYAREFGDLAAEGFNTAVMVIDPIAYGDRYREVLAAMLEEAEKAGVKLIMPLGHVQGLLAEMRAEISESEIYQAAAQDYFDFYKESPAVLGYVLFDEPVPEGAPGPDGQTVKPEQLGKARAFVEREHPGAYGLSSWADVNNMAALQEGMHSRVLFMDVYPLAEDKEIGDFSDAWPRGSEEDGSFAGGADQPTYFEYLDMSREEVPGVPQWVIVQAFEPIPPEHPHYWRMPEPAELRLEVFAALAHGAKGIFYFLYQSESWVHGLRDADYQPTALLAEARRINAKVRAMGDTLLAIERDDAHRPQAGSGEAFAYTGPQGARYVFVVNTDVLATRNVQLTLDPAWAGASVASDVYDGSEFEVSGGVLTVAVQPGDGRLLRLR